MRRLKRVAPLLLLLALPGALVASCGADGDDGDCGPGEAPADGITGTVDGSTLTYGMFTSSANNDCTAAGSPTSLTIEARQASTGRFLVLCIPAPDAAELEAGAPIALTDDTVTSGIQVIDVFGEVDGCLISIDRARAVSGTATFAGYCQQGLDPAGYSLALSGAIPVTKSCPTDGGTDDTPTEIGLTGEAAVESINL